MENFPNRMLAGLGPWCQGYLWCLWDPGKSGLGWNADRQLCMVKFWMRWLMPCRSRIFRRR